MIANLKKLRQEKGISQQQLADIILVSQQSVNKYENHNVEPDIEILIEIAEYFNVTLDYLVGRTDKKEERQKSDLTNDEKSLLNEYNQLNKNQKMFIFNIIENFKKL